jgi:hypothetical protein
MSVKLIAYYLPQYHPIPENDAWWGKGFTEWTNVAKAKPLFRGHYQPRLPADLGFYDLRVPEVREQQAELAVSHGVDAFCYWHYWFGNGKKLLEMPINEVLKTGKPNILFCFAWANHTWGGLDFGDGFERILIEQTYPGINDHEQHFYYNLPFFTDTRYLKVNGKPVFQINHPTAIPEVKQFIEFWNKLAQKNGLPGIYFIAHDYPDFDYQSYNYDAISFFTPSHLIKRYKQNQKPVRRKINKAIRLLRGKARMHKPQIIDYQYIVDASNYSDLDHSKNFCPVAIPNWDHSPRSKNHATILINEHPDLFYKNLKNCYNLIRHKENQEEQIIFIKSWNEWAEGNYLEPDRVFGHKYLEAIKRFKKELQ